jgi:hypothetical protein
MLLWGQIYNYFFNNTTNYSHKITILMRKNYTHTLVWLSRPVFSLDSCSLLRQSGLTMNLVNGLITTLQVRTV